MLTMGVSLYTVRIVLNTLGIEDYGIYNVVGGVVTSFSVLTSTLSSASQRFFAVEIGRSDFVNFKRIFSMTVLIYLALAVVIFILAETVGMWFLTTKLSYPSEREVAVQWVYQFSIFSFMVTLLAIPYNAAIIAYEKMRTFAYMSVLEAVLKLSIVYLLVIFSYDKLKLYAVLMFAVTIIITLAYRAYCIRRLKGCQFGYYWNKATFKTLLNYSGWNLFGTLTSVSYDQGINFLLNIYFGPVVNAARAVAYQVNNALTSFSSNFYTAVRPQIIKSYIGGDREYFLRLIFSSTKFSFFLQFVLSLPIFLEIDFVLRLWLGIVPSYVASFVKLILVFSLTNVLQIPITTAMQATGDIKRYQIVVGTVMLLCLPISYFLIKSGFPSQAVFYVMIALSIIALIFRLQILKSFVELNYTKYFKEVILRLIIVGTFSAIPVYFIVMRVDQGMTRFVLTCSSSTIITGLFIYTLGLTKDERLFIGNGLASKFKRIKVFK